MSAKHPTPQGISALLRKAGHQRGISRLRGGMSGYSVSKLGIDAVEVRYSSVTMGRPSAYRYAKLAEYAADITKAGWAVRTDPALPRLIVTAAPDEPSTSPKEG